MQGYIPRIYTVEKRTGLVQPIKYNVMGNRWSGKDCLCFCEIETLFIFKLVPFPDGTV